MALLLTVVLFLSTLESSHAVKLTAVKFDLGGAPPNLTGPLEQNYDLTEAERYKADELNGPVSFVYYREHIFTGLADGRIVDISDCGVRTVTKLATPGCKGDADCGRPLGMRLDNRGRLLVANSAKGILRVNVDTGETEVLFSIETPVNGKKCKFINDVIVAKDGTVLFTDSSARWTQKESIYVVMEGETTGRLLAHSDKSNKTIVVLDNLAFPNGLEFGPNEEYILVTETARARVRKLDLKPGKTWLQLSTFVENLPGLPDNIRTSGRGTYWVAMMQSRHQNMSTMFDEYANQPQMREMIAMMSSPQQILDMTDKYGMIVELNSAGQIIRSLQDPTGNHVAGVTEAVEHNGYLYLGNFDKPYVSRIALTKAFHVERFLHKIKSTCRATKINLGKLRVVLRRLVAIAEFRRALLNVKKRREELLAMQEVITPTSIPDTTSAFVDLNTTATEGATNFTTASYLTMAQNITESTTVSTIAELSLLENTTMFVSAGNRSSEVSARNMSTEVVTTTEAYTTSAETTQTTTESSVTTIRTTSPEVAAVGPNTEATETESNTGPPAASQK